MENQIAHLMQCLNCTEAEAVDIIESDKAIDRGEKLFELSADQKQAVKDLKTKAVGRRPAVYKFAKRERKADNDKRFLIETLAQSVKNFMPEVTNPEREIQIVYNGRKFKIVLSAPRD